MKTVKKSVSLLLALCMLISSFAVCFSVFAAESSLDKAKESITALAADKTNINTAAPTDETKLAAYNNKLALYNVAVADYKALSVEEKDEFDVICTLNLLRAVTEREAYVIKTDYDSQLPADATNSDKMTAIESRVKATEKLDEILGEHPTRTQALEFGNKYLGTKHLCADGKTMLAVSSNLNFTKYPEMIPYAKEYIAAYKAADQGVRMYLDGYSATFFSYSSNTVGAVFTDAVKLIGKIAVYENPFDGGEKPVINNKKPNSKNYAGGVNDPEYIAALELYLADKKVFMEYSQAEKLHEYNFYLEAIKELKEIIPEAKTACEVALTLYDGYFDFDKNGSTEKAKLGMDAYNAMTSEYDVTFYKKLGSVYVYYLIYLNSKKDDYAYSNLAISQLYAKCEETAGMSMIADFEEWVMSVDISTVDNAVVALAEDKYAELPKALLPKISDEASAQYSAILALYDPAKPMVPSDYSFEKEIAEFEPVKGLASVAGVNKAFNIIATVENTLANVVYKLSVGTLIKNENVSIVGSLYDLLVDANIISSGINVSKALATELKPSDMASFLVEEKFAGAKAKLLAAAEVNDTTDAYADIKFESGDWGFEDGDSEGFANALAAALRPAADVLHNGILILNNIIYLPNYTSNKGDYVYGAYEELIPILEGIGLEGVISSQEYTERFYASQKGNTYDYLDSLVLPILQPVVNLIGKLEKNVVFTLFDILPNVARMIDTDFLDTQLHVFLAKSSTLSGVEFDLTKDAVTEMISGLTFEVPVGKLFKFTIGLNNINWNKLSRCGTLCAVSSASASNALRLYISADRARVQENIAKSVSISL
ncbi:MAG: hypothetical protein ACI4VI_09945 [Acutalibacteraceae bacterium]